MNNRDNVLNNLCDISGYSYEELDERFEDMNASEILESLNEEQRADLEEYAGIKA